MLCALSSSATEKRKGVLGTHGGEEKKDRKKLPLGGSPQDKGEASIIRKECAWWCSEAQVLPGLLLKARHVLWNDKALM